MVEKKLFKFWNIQLLESESDYCLVTQTELYFYQPVQGTNQTEFLDEFMISDVILKKPKTSYVSENR